MSRNWLNVISIHRYEINDSIFIYFCVCFQVLLILASQRIESVLNNWFGTSTLEWVSDDVTTKRGAPPTMIEWLILSWVCGNGSHSLYRALLVSLYAHLPLPSLSLPPLFFSCVPYRKSAPQFLPEQKG